MNDCIFCKISKKEIPASIILEDENFLAFLDINQNTYGHTLIIPKQHASNLFETTNEIKEEIIFFVQKVKQKLEENLQPKGFNVISNIGETAGQTVFHAHIHVLPRYEQDEFNFSYDSSKKVDLKELYEKIK